MSFFAKLGEEVTCTNGHVVARVGTNIPIHGAVPQTSSFIWESGQEPEPNSLYNACRCARCGATYVRSAGIDVQLHVGTFWRGIRQGRVYETII